MSGKSWCPGHPLRVTVTAGQVWAKRFPALPLWDAYRRGTLSKTQAGEVEVTDVKGKVVFSISPEDEGDGWVLTSLRAV